VGITTACDEGWEPLGAHTDIPLLRVKTSRENKKAGESTMRWDSPAYFLPDGSRRVGFWLKLLGLAGG
jgi:hypothetical protein